MKTKKVVVLLVLLLGLGLILASCDDVLGLGSEIEEGSDTTQENDNDSTDTGTETGNGEESSNDDDTDTGTETGNGENPAQDDVAEYQLKDLSDLEYRDMVEVPGGRFLQQSSSHDGFDHTISSFEIGKYLVTYELWYTVRVWAEDNEYEFANPGREGSVGTTGAEPTAQGKHEPVTGVSWRDSIVWLNAYSEMENRNWVYYADEGFDIPIRESSALEAIQDNSGQIDNPFVNWEADGYRLPTEGEWEYAASYQDGTNWTPFNYASGATADYNNTTATGEVAWYAENSGDKTQTVATKLANQLEIHDMSGNVWEWTWDWRTDYPAGPETDYRGPDTGSGRVDRGGSWGFTANALQVGFRSGSDPPWFRSHDIGFRPARSVDTGGNNGDEIHLVMFDSQGGTSVGFQTVDSGGTVVEPTAPEWDGEGDFQFIGWSDDAVGGTLWDYDTPVTGDITLYAKWWEGTYWIGDVGPAGGWIFYVDIENEFFDWTYLEAWIVDEDGTHRWMTNITSIPGTSTEIGRGYENTYSVLLGTNHPAAEVVRNANHGDVNDWFLPSIDELIEMYENLHKNEKGGFSSASYWSSSEHFSHSAWVQGFYSGSQFYDVKDGLSRVRAVRAF